jgi:hypothetical protein
MSVTTSVSSWIFAIVLLGVVPACFSYLLLGPWRESRRDRRDILANGQAATGTVVAIDETYPAGKARHRFVVTVEFTPPEYQEPVRAQINCGSSEVNKLGVYQQVPIHYRVQTPMEAVIDEFVR